MAASQPVNANNLIVEDSNWIKVTCQCHIFLKKYVKVTNVVQKYDHNQILQTKSIVIYLCYCVYYCGTLLNVKLMVTTR